MLREISSDCRQQGVWQEASFGIVGATSAGTHPHHLLRLALQHYPQTRRSVDSERGIGVG